MVDSTAYPKNGHGGNRVNSGRKVGSKDKKKILGELVDEKIREALADVVSDGVLEAVRELLETKRIFLQASSPLNRRRVLEAIQKLDVIRGITYAQTDPRWPKI